MNARIAIPQEGLSAFCQRWRIKELALFGSVLREDFGQESDVDVLVTFESEARVTLFDMVHMQDELSEMIGRNVDLVSRRGIERSENFIRRKAILSSAEVIHVS